MATSDCVFCKIAAGEIPSLRVWESPHAVGFLDIGPLSAGHTLLIPKQHYENILDVPRDVLGMLIGDVQDVAKAVVRTTGAAGFNILQNTGAVSGQAVFHLHFHIIPRVVGDKLGYRWNAGKYANGEAEALQDKIVRELSR